LAGQIADGCTTPLVGFASDKFQTRIGSRIPWYIAGTIIILPSFLMLFIYPDLETNSTEQIIYYIVFAITLNIGYAFAQITHMAIVNSITFSS
jgi:Na+/melibiose symporter-like transporter